MVKFNDNTPLYLVGEPIEFSGYADDFSSGISAMQFTLDGGNAWTSYPTSDARAEEGLNWTFSFTPREAGTYMLRVRSLDDEGVPSPLIANYPFQAMRAEHLPREYGSFHLRAFDGGALYGAKLFRSAALGGLDAQDALFISDTLGIRSIFDIRGAHEAASSPEPCLLRVKTVTLEARDAGRRKDASKRLVAGVIGRYGAPEARMAENYRRYVSDYPLIGMALRSIASQDAPALIHCENGKDRTGVLCAVAMRVAGFDDDAVMGEYLRSNQVSAREISAERARLGTGMTDEELRVLDSFLEARPAYLHAFFEEARRRFGSFDEYVARGLRLTDAHRKRLGELLRREA